MTCKIDTINPKTAGTIDGLFRERVRRTPDACAYRHFSEEKQHFVATTWQQIFRLAGRWQAALRREELQPGDRAAVILRNCPEWVLFDLAALGLGLVTVPMFPDDPPSTIGHILKESGARLVFIQDREHWASIEDAGVDLHEIVRVLTLQSNPYHGDSRTWTPDNPGDESEDPGAGNGPGAGTGRKSFFAALADWLPEDEKEYEENNLNPDNPATIVYTSGATGMPKGVMLSHANILENAFACLRRVPISAEDLFLSFLPLSHTFERTVGYYIPMMAGACVAYARSIEKLPEDLSVIRPTVLISVPRIYERVHGKIEAGLKKKSFLARALFRLTVHTGWQRFLYLHGRSGWKPLFLMWPLLKLTVAKRLLDAFGGRLRLSISGGAPMAPLIARVFIGLGLNFLQGYGLTETSPVISVNTMADNDPATVGQALPGVETLIAPDGELLVRGPNVMLGYWQNRDATRATIDSSGYLHTGDVAEMDAGGRIKIVGRIKEIIVLSTGRKIPPGDLELAITSNPLFEQAMVVGESRPYLAALVVLNGLEWEKLAAAEGLPWDPREIIYDERVDRILLTEIARMTSHFPEYARIRKIHASLTPWRRRDGLITNTLKLRRKEILEKFKPQVESLYQGR